MLISKNTDSKSGKFLTTTALQKTRLAGFVGQIHQRHPNTKLVPTNGKIPLLKNWTDLDLTKDELISYIFNGIPKTSAKGKEYTATVTGLAVSLGDMSDGLLAIDCDGASAIGLISKLINRYETEKDAACEYLFSTLACTSNKAPGRFQSFFTVPDSLRDKFKRLTKIVINEGCNEGEALEIRYNRSLSMLPPSIHPTTEKEYKWMRLDKGVLRPYKDRTILLPDTPIQEVPAWVVALVDEEIARQEKEQLAKKEAEEFRQKMIAERKAAIAVGGSYALENTGDLSDIVANVLDRLTADEVYNWHGHQFTKRNSEWRGFCPRHQSSSGTAFVVNTQERTWYCHGCAVGGDAISYRSFVENGNPKPRRGEFWDTMKRLAEDAGVELPTRSSKNVSCHTPPIKRSIIQQGVTEECIVPKLDPIAQLASDFLIKEGLTDPKDKKKKDKSCHTPLVNVFNTPGYVTKRLDPFSERNGLQVQPVAHANYTHHVINEQFLSLENCPIKQNAINVIRSPMNTGKSFGIIKRLADIYDAVLGLYPLISLAREGSKKTRLHYKDAVLTPGSPEARKRASCINSVSYFDPMVLRLWEGGFFFIDEFDQCLNNLTSPMCNRRGERIGLYSTFKMYTTQAVQKGVAVFLSADIAEQHINLIKHEFPNTPINFIDNIYVPNEKTVIYDTSETPDIQLKTLLDTLKSGQPCIVFSDAKTGVRGCHALAENVKATTNLKVLEINSDTTHKPEIIEVLSDFDNKTKDIDLVICSPSVISGLSIESDRFAGGVFIFCSGTITPTQVSQASNRVRKATEINVWVRKTSKRRIPSDPQNFGDYTLYLSRNWKRQSKIAQGYNGVFDFTTELWRSALLQYVDFTYTLNNYDYRNLREQVKLKFLTNGYGVLETIGGEKLDKEFATPYRQQQLSEVQKTAQADDNLGTIEFEMWREKVRGQKENPHLPVDQVFLDKRQYAGQKRILKERYGNEFAQAAKTKAKIGSESIELTGFEALAWIDENNKHHYSKCLNYYDLFCTDSSLIIDSEMGSIQKEIRVSKDFLPLDTRFRLVKRSAYLVLGLDKYVLKYKDGETIPKEADEEILQAVLTTEKKWKNLCKDQLNLDVAAMVEKAKESDKPINAATIVGMLLDTLGIKRKSKQVRQGKQRVRQYSIDVDSIQQLDSFVQHREAWVVRSKALQLLNAYGREAERHDRGFKNDIDLYRANIFENPDNGVTLDEEKALVKAIESYFIMSGKSIDDLIGDYDWAVSEVWVKDRAKTALDDSLPEVLRVYASRIGASTKELVAV